MPELTWTTALAWFGVLAGAASSAAWVFGGVGPRQTTRLQADIHAATQAILADLGKGFRETQQQLSQTLERMDERWREVSDRMDQRADDRHREVISAVQALKS